jgi:hypothetical protein
VVARKRDEVRVLETLVADLDDVANGEAVGRFGKQLQCGEVLGVETLGGRELPVDRPNL